VATVHDAVKESGQVLPHPSVVFHASALANIPWVAQTISHCTPVKRGKVSFNPLTHEATKFEDCKCPICVSRFKCLLIQTQPMRALTDIGRVYCSALIFEKNRIL
jgi:hypothetical protein